MKKGLLLTPYVFTGGGGGPSAPSTPASPSAPAGTSRAGRISRNPKLNYGTQVDQLGGITVGNGIILVNMDPDRRYHNIRFQITAVNYTGGTNLTATALTGSGTALKVDVTVNTSGIVTAIIPHSGSAGSGFTTGDTITFTDATGKGFVGTVTASAGAVTAIAITSVGTPTAAPAGKVLGLAQLLVNGSPVRDISVQQALNVALFNNETISLGQLPLFFTEPWRNVMRWPDITSWDMVGQNTFSVKIAINSGWQQVNCVGTYEFDFNRNTIFGVIDQATYQSALATGNAPAPMLHIIAHHAFTPTLNAGANILTGAQIPITAPWVRCHLVGSTTGQLTQAILLEDSQTIESGFIGASSNGGQLDQLLEELIERGFNTTLFDYSYVSDKDQRIQNVLKFIASLKWSIYSNIAQGLTIVQESLHAVYE